MARKKIAKTDPLERLSAEMQARMMRDRQAAQEEEKAWRAQAREGRSSPEGRGSRTASGLCPGRTAADGRGEGEARRGPPGLADQATRAHAARGHRMESARGDDDSRGPPSSGPAMTPSRSSMAVWRASIRRRSGPSRPMSPDSRARPWRSSGETWRSIIKARIESEDYSFNELGKEAEISPSVIMRYVKGERDIRAETAEKICSALNLVLVPAEMIRPQR